MPQERSDARKMERELKIKFDWREADKNLAKEERNKPLEMGGAPMDSLLGMETRSWKTGRCLGQNQTASLASPYRRKRLRPPAQRQRLWRRTRRRRTRSRRQNSRPGSSRSGPARRGR